MMFSYEKGNGYDRRVKVHMLFRGEALCSPLTSTRHRQTRKQFISKPCKLCEAKAKRLKHALNNLSELN